MCVGDPSSSQAEGATSPIGNPRTPVLGGLSGFAHLFGRRTHSLLTERRPDFDPDADDCVSSVPVVSERRRETLASGRERERGVWSRADADTTLLIRQEVSGILA